MIALLAEASHIGLGPCAPLIGPASLIAMLAVALWLDAYGRCAKCRQRRRTECGCPRKLGEKR